MPVPAQWKTPVVTPGKGHPTPRVVNQAACDVQFRATGIGGSSRRTESDCDVIGRTGMVDGAACDGKDAGGSGNSGEDEPVVGIDGAAGDQADADRSGSGGRASPTEHEPRLGEGGTRGHREGTVTAVDRTQGGGVAVRGGGERASGEVDRTDRTGKCARRDGGATGHGAATGDIENGVSDRVSDCYQPGGSRSAARHKGPGVNCRCSRVGIEACEGSPCRHPVW